MKHMRKGGNRLDKLPPKAPQLKPPRPSLLELNLIRHVTDKDWPVKKKLLDDPWS